MWLLIATVALIALLTVLSVRGKKLWEDIAVAQFNQQQLAIAQSIAGRIQDYVTSLQRLLEILGEHYTPSQEGSVPEPWQHLQDLPILKVTVIDPRGTQAYVSPDGTISETPISGRNTTYLTMSPSSDPPYISDAYQVDRADKSALWALDIVTREPGCLIVWTVDVVSICRQAITEIRSGSTGYAWILNADGYFLAHYDPSFVGKNAFVARARKYPTISFSMINQLQKDYLLAGKEGTGWYTAGWHQDNPVPVKKLFAYTPAYFAGRGQKDKFWAVAVSAPMDEVNGIIAKALYFQWGLTVTALLIVFGMAGYALYQRWRYTHQLREEVARKTSELQEINRALVHSERLAAMGTAVAHVAHEIKNPLMVIGGFAGQLLKSFEKPDKTRTKLEIIVSEARRLETFLRDIGQFARETIPEPEPVDLNHVIKELLTMVESTLDQRRITLETYLPGSLMVHADPNHVRQVLLNLVRNATDAMPEGGRLTLRAYKNQRAIIKVSDTGSGMSREVADKAFEPFFSTKKEGSGMGLSICHKLVVANRGNIYVDSEEDLGTTITVTFPLVSPESR
jgi:signal transduction histidine kinase